MPELSRTSGRRVAFISEPSHNDTLNLGIVKEVTGGDAMFTRGLYETGSEITCGFVPILLCNVLPAVTDTSHGAWRRLVSVTFPTLFVEHPKLPNEVKMDSYVDESIKAWADAFATMIATYKVEGSTLSIPKDISLNTQEYQTESDFYSEYIHERIIHTGQVREGEAEGVCCGSIDEIEEVNVFIFRVYREWRDTTRRSTARASIGGTTSRARRKGSTRSGGAPESDAPTKRIRSATGRAKAGVSREQRGHDASRAR